MKERKIAREEGLTFAYRDAVEGEKTPWHLKTGEPIVPVYVPDPSESGMEDNFEIWGSGLTSEDLDFCVQFYYDRWNFSADSCDRDKKIVDVLVDERTRREARIKHSAGSSAYSGSSSFYVNAGVGGSTGVGGAITITGGTGGGGGSFLIAGKK